MDTRQLVAFCAVVERKSFSQAAERLGVTQPAVSLQIRSLEQRLGRRLLDRSGRRVEPTEAGLRLYASAQRLLQLEEQLLEEVAADDEGVVAGTLELGASTASPTVSSSSASSARAFATAASRSSRSSATRSCSRSQPATHSPARPSP